MTIKTRRYNDALRKQDAAGLSGDLIKLRREQFSLRMQSASGQTIKSSDFGKSKKNIARVKTELNAQKKAAGAKK